MEISAILLFGTADILGLIGVIFLISLIYNHFSKKMQSRNRIPQARTTMPVYPKAHEPAAASNSNEYQQMYYEPEQTSIAVQSKHQGKRFEVVTTLGSDAQYISSERPRYY